MQSSPQNATSNFGGNIFVPRLQLDFEETLFLLATCLGKGACSLDTEIKIEVHHNL